MNIRKNATAMRNAMSKKNDILSDLAALSSAVQTTHKKEDGNVVSRWSWKVPVQ